MRLHGAQGPAQASARTTADPAQGLGGTLSGEGSSCSLGLPVAGLALPPQVPGRGQVRSHQHGEGLGGWIRTNGEDEGVNQVSHICACFEKPGHVPTGERAAERRGATLRLEERRRRETQAYNRTHPKSSNYKCGNVIQLSMVLQHCEIKEMLII